MTHRDGLSELSVRSQYRRDVGHHKMLATRPKSSERPPFRSLLGPVGGRQKALTMSPHRLWLASYLTGPRSDPYGSLLSPFGITRLSLLISIQVAIDTADTREDERCAPTEQYHSIDGLYTA